MGHITAFCVDVILVEAVVGFTVTVVVEVVVGGVIVVVGFCVEVVTVLEIVGVVVGATVVVGFCVEDVVSFIVEVVVGFGAKVVVPFFTPKSSRAVTIKNDGFDSMQIHFLVVLNNDSFKIQISSCVLAQIPSEGPDAAK